MSGTPARSDTPPSKAEFVLNQLREDIIAGRLAPGDPLNQGELATRYRVSATPVREALRRLESEGLISYAPYRGATVTGLDGTELEDFYRLRSVMEGLATRLATERAGLPMIERLRELNTELRAGAGTGDGHHLAQLNREFHFCIYEAGSRLVAGQVRSLWNFIPPEVTMWAQRDAAEVFSRQHDGIIDALEAGDEGGADRLMAEHVLTAARRRSHDRSDD